MTHARSSARTAIRLATAAALLTAAYGLPSGPALADDGYYSDGRRDGWHDDRGQVWRDRDDDWPDDDWRDDDWRDDDEDDDDRDNGRDDDHDRARQLLEQGRIRSLSDILARVGPALDGRLIETEFERENGLYVYEFTVVRPDGRVQEVYVDAATGRVVKIEDD